MRKEIPHGVHVTVELQYRKCNRGKTGNCKCGKSLGHGPYYYGYFRHEKKIHSVYFGKMDLQSIKSILDENGNSVKLPSEV